MKKNQIYIKCGTDYTAMTMELLETCDLAGEIEQKSDLQNMRIGIKPNLVAPMEAYWGGTTHPEVVAGIVEYLQEKGFSNLVIMEGSWVGDRTEESFEVCGYTALAEKYGVQLIDAQKEPAVIKNCRGMELHLCRCATETDFMINVPVMKGHCQTHITCALKNMKGLLPNKEKRRFHAEGLHRPIAHLALGIHQDFILVDSICGDLSFEDGGNPVQMDRLMAGTDPVLMDTYVCRMLGYEVQDVPYIRMAEELEAGSADMENAVIRELNEPLYPMQQADKNRVMRLSELAEEVESCSACYGYLIPALDMLDKEGLLGGFDGKICIGQGYRGKTGELGVGSCTSGFCHSLKGCPPTETEMYEFLKEYMTKTKGTDSI